MLIYIDYRLALVSDKVLMISYPALGSRSSLECSPPAIALVGPLMTWGQVPPAPKNSYRYGLLEQAATGLLVSPCRRKARMALRLLINDLYSISGELSLSAMATSYHVFLSSINSLQAASRPKFKLADYQLIWTWKN